MDLASDDTLPDPSRSADGLDLPAALALDDLKSRLFGEPTTPRRRLGRYRVVRILGEGGMGVVFHAHDDELSRPVALKVLHGDDGEGPSQRPRMLREAQAMAQLSHPHVVQVYDVGEHDGQAFIAMELVRGQPLRDWIEDLGDPVARCRRWKDIVGMFVQAGRGLAAAHAVGLVHRDFKPANALVGEDGRVRVLDFGLARARRVTGGDERPRADEPFGTHGGKPPAFERTITVAGSVLGTPAYISPEQVAGDPATAASDQFSLCVALYEALYGVRPFEDLDLHARVGQMQAGSLVAPPSGVVIPDWLHAAVVRGLAFDPDDRWPSLDALLQALLDDPARRRRRRLILGGVSLLLVAGPTGAWIHAQREQARCEAEGAAVRDDWSEEARRSMHAAFEATGLPFASPTAERLGPRLDAWADEWSDARTRACLDARSDRRGDRLREICLERQRWQLAQTMDVLARADRGVVMQAVSLVAGLPRTAACDEPGGLAAVAASTSGEHPRAALDDVRRQLAQVVVDERAGRAGLALQGARAATERAEALGDDALRAEAHHRLGRVLEQRGDHPDAEQALRQAYFTAGGIGNDPVAVDAAVALVAVVGSRLARPREGREWAAQASMIMRRMGIDPEQATAEYFENLGHLAVAEAKYREAVDAFERALARHEQRGGGDHPATAAVLGDLAASLRILGEYDRAMEINARALEISERTLGPEHPDVAIMLDDLGALHVARGDPAEAVTHYRRALEIQEAILGPETAPVASTLAQLGIALRTLGRLEDAREIQRRAVTTARHALGPEHPETARYPTNLGITLSLLGDLDEAEQQHRRALALREKALGAEHHQLVDSLYALAYVLTSKGNNEDAVPLYERALAIEQAAMGPDHPDVASVLDGLGYALLQLGRADEALRRHRRALAIRERVLDSGHPDLSNSYQYIGRASLARGEPEEAVEWYRRALALREATDGPEQLMVAETLRWLSDALRAAGRLAEARRNLERALAVYERVGDAPVDIAHTMMGLGEVQLDADEPTAAVMSFERALELWQTASSDPRLTCDARFGLARAQWSAGIERARAVQLAHEARDCYAPLGPGAASSVEDVTSWLAPRDGPG